MPDERPRGRRRQPLPGLQEELTDGRPACGGRAVPRLENAVLDEQLDQLVDPPPVHEARVARHHLPDRLACRQLPELHVATSVPASPLYHLGFGSKPLGLFPPGYLLWVVGPQQGITLGGQRACVAIAAV